ncbi:MAG: hypothetical protein KGL95_03225 [Patescibacteria group bacterium]|nr:hypothetical protein [Patescibacteria group bacterium]
MPEHSFHELKTILEWTAPGRPFVKRGRQYFATALLIMFLVEIILFLFSQYLLMLVIVSLVFVSFALASVPPHDFTYRISTQGFFLEDHFFLWKELYDFFFSKQSGQDVLVLRTKAIFPGEVVVTLGHMKIEHVKKALLPYLSYREYITPTFMEKTGNWMAETFPLEPTHPHSKVASRK